MRNLEPIGDLGNFGAFWQHNVAGSIAYNDWLNCDAASYKHRTLQIRF